MVALIVVWSLAMLLVGVAAGSELAVGTQRCWFPDHDREVRA